MKKPAIVALIVAAVVVVAGLAVFAMGQDEAEAPEPASTTEQTTEQDTDTADEATDANQDGQDADDGAANSASTIDIEDFAFSPATITVKKGTTVTWTNQDSMEHDITPDSPTDEFKKSELLSKGQSYSVTFETPGTYTYHCSPHSYMQGTVVVTE